MALDFTRLDVAVGKFRTASPNIAAAFDELKPLLRKLDALPGYTLAEVTVDRSLNPRTATQIEIANVLGTLITDIRK